MNLVFEINKRLAIPVRAIPYLTNWAVLTPDEIIKALAFNGEKWRSIGLKAYTLKDGEVHTLPSSWWLNICFPKIDALESKIRESHTSERTAYLEWQTESTKVIPAGTFIWKDEFEDRFLHLFNQDSVSFTSSQGITASEVEHESIIELHYKLLITDSFLEDMLMEGFKKNESSTQKTIVSESVSQVSDDSVQNSIKHNQTQSSTWSVVRPKRLKVYRKPLLELLKKKADNCEPIPNAHEVLAIWIVDKPKEIETINDESFTYLDQKGSSRIVTLSALNQTIRNQIIYG